jgi:hypothetical protein
VWGIPESNPAGCSTTTRFDLKSRNDSANPAPGPLIQFTGKAGIPPEIYRLTYNLRGRYVSGSGETLERDTHLNGLAAKWAAQNSHRLPIDPRLVAPRFRNPEDPATPQPEAIPAAEQMPPAPTQAADLRPNDPCFEKIVIASENQ